MSRITSVALDDLNAEQRAAVEHGSAPLLVIAGAGSGKTKTLSCRVAHLVANGADPSRILLLTFSRRAASEMIARVGKVMAGDVRIPWAGTFHAIGARLLRELAPVIGIDPEFTIHDRSDSADLMSMVRQELGVATGAKRFPMKGTCLAIYSRVVNADESIDDAVVAQFPWCREWTAELKTLFGAYVEAKQKQNVLDYDDLLWLWAEAMNEPALAAEVGARFEHVLVDEYQDTNKLQARILLAMKPDGRGVTVVGDDAQSIYSFRAADVRNILEFPKAFTPEARLVTLEQNYRSTSPILDASNAVIDLAKERFTKNLRTTRSGGTAPKLVSVRDEAAQASYIAESVLEARERGLTLMQQAILFRAADFSAPVELELAKRDIPFVKFGGLKFLEAAHVKDFLAILRWAQNGGDRIAGFRTLQLVPGVGPAKAARILDAVDEFGPYGAVRNTAPPAGAAEAWDALKEMLAAMEKTPAWPSDLDLAARWYTPMMNERYDDARVRAGDIDQLQRIGATFGGRTSFLTELTLDPPNSTSDESGKSSKDDDYLILSTIHSAKGQEWKNVFVLNVVDGCMPSDLGTGSTAALEEERRLLYVAMTRAKDELHLITPQRFYHTQQSRGGDKHVYAIKSRFLPEYVCSKFQQTAWAPEPAPGEAGANGPLPKIDLAAKARSRFS
ncbi:ATP-dependent helicase [Candidatus Viadribacter manganicus]|uniref:DNA 3'-5' helicase n=1 Tax=Candidatus Viadribacter manganicus TaxID=1759059 RepID=A0A1B1AHT3_9PROT|nr:ATP-dependent helicase [Candidatus Viadribacter manganicus]ANP46123.1 ATP-dependent DNA helicase [Candidatus Viadribacter manganicus]